MHWSTSSFSISCSSMIIQPHCYVCHNSDKKQPHWKLVLGKYLVIEVTRQLRNVPCCWMPSGQALSGRTRIGLDSLDCFDYLILSNYYNFGHVIINRNSHNGFYFIIRLIIHSCSPTWLLDRTSLPETARRCSCLLFEEAAKQQWPQCRYQFYSISCLECTVQHCKTRSLPGQINYR